jgi:hypothetical protein
MLGAGGQLGQELEPVYRVLLAGVDDVLRAVEHWPAAGDRLPVCVVRYCALALSVGYRIGSAEVLVLGLLDAESAAGIVAASLDWPDALRERVTELIAAAEAGGIIES